MKNEPVCLMMTLAANAFRRADSKAPLLVCLSVFMLRTRKDVMAASIATKIAVVVWLACHIMNYELGGCCRIANF